MKQKILALAFIIFSGLFFWQALEIWNFDTFLKELFSPLLILVGLVFLMGAIILLKKAKKDQHLISDRKIWTIVGITFGSLIIALAIYFAILSRVSF